MCILEYAGIGLPLPTHRGPTNVHLTHFAMKTFLTLALVCCLAFIFASHTDKNATPASSAVRTLESAPTHLPTTLSLFTDPGNIVAVRDVTLKDGVSATDFERFAVEEFTPVFEHQVPGVKAFIMKGDRGDKKGSYSYVLIFDSPNTRDFYYPFEHGGEESVPATSETLWLPAREAIYQKLVKYVDGIGETQGYTDYIVLGADTEYAPAAKQ